MFLALGTLGFDDYCGPMKRYLNRYRESESDKVNLKDLEEIRPTEDLEDGDRKSVV